MTDTTNRNRKSPSYVAPPNAMKTWKPTTSVPTARVRMRGDSIEVTYNFQHRLKPTLERQALRFARLLAKVRLEDQKASVSQIDSETSRVMTYRLARREEWFTDEGNTSKGEVTVATIIEELNSSYAGRSTLRSHPLSMSSAALVMPLCGPVMSEHSSARPSSSITAVIVSWQSCIASQVESCSEPKPCVRSSCTSRERSARFDFGSAYQMKV